MLTPFRREPKLDSILNDLNIGIIHLDHNYQKKIHGIFFGTHNLGFYEHINKIKSKKIQVYLNKIYITNLLKFLKKKYKIKFVINFAIHYKSEFLYDDISNRLNLKFITLHRECLFASENIINFNMSKLKNHIRYKGHKIIVHNEICKKIFYESGFCDKEKIEVIGPLRVDDNVKFKNEIKTLKKSKTILFYIFGTGAMIMRNHGYGSEWIENGWNNLLKNTYKSLIKLAEKYNECEFIFKAKFANSDFFSYHDILTKKFNGKNIKFETEEKNYSLLKRSDLVIAFNSTTVIEALLFNKNLLMPFFDEAQKIEYSKYIAYKEIKDTEIFCKSEEEFINKISNTIESKKKYFLSDLEKLKLIRSCLGETDGKNFIRTKNFFSLEL